MSSLRCTYSGGDDYHYFKGGEALNVHSLYVHGIHVSKANCMQEYAPDCTILGPKLKKLPTMGGATPSLPHAPPARSLRSLAKSLGILKFKCWEVWKGEITILRQRDDGRFREGLWFVSQVDAIAEV